MSDLSRIVAALSRVNWDFPNSGTGMHGVHALHAFPGNSIPQIPNTFIQILSSPGDIVFDPFGGSGTTAVEALRLGRNAICSDLLSTSVMAMRGKVAAYIDTDLGKFVCEILLDLAWDHICETDEVGSNMEGSADELKKWYHTRTLRQLKYIWNLIENSPEPFRPILELLFSDVLFSCATTMGSKTSSGLTRRHHWGWVADNVQPPTLIENNAVENFRKRLAQLSNLLIDSAETTSVSWILRQDAKALALKDSCVDVVVTSPPYVGVIDYARASRLIYMWKNWDLDKERFNETGARYKRGRKSLRSDYLEEMRACWKEVYRVLKPGGFCAVVVGESRSYPGTVETTLRDMSDLLKPIWGVTERVPSRRRVYDRSARDAVEYLMVWRKE